ncbi:phospholipase c [Niveomyces insectorum RCEF 264]|uniref:Phosphoinositide phospholipase C n=1 Tax=Niveomyces insectorum RCEF 264 TaxID=1081102 RepID=A0A167UKT5_9HYPO|nr:phospholipase c [Niveomyces insectorum RCEF 264]
MGFLTRRHGRKAPGDNNQQHGVHNVLRLLVGTTTLISPTHNGHHRRRSIVTLKDASGAAAAHPNEPLIFLGETTLTRLQQIFHELCGRSATFYKSFPLPAALVSPPTLTRERLARFLEHVQGAAAVDLPLDKPRYCFEEFLELWYYQFGWDASRPPLEEEVLDLSLPISHYFISSSHNTYLVGNQLSSEASVGEYQKVLEKNCRCIEIDVWNPPAKSGQKVPSRSKSPRRQFHRQHLSTSSVATSIHDGFEAVTNLLAAKMSHSRASSFSRKSMSAPPPTSPPADVVVKTANTVDAPSPPDGNPPALTPQAALRGRLLGAHSRPMVEQAIEDDDNDDDDDDDATVASENARVRSETQDDTTTVSQGTTVTMSTAATATAAISITAPDADNSAAASPTPSAPPDVVFDDDDNDDGAASADTEPVVMHAHNLLSSDWTLGTHVPFRDVCRAVRNSAFRTNPLPIIVSLEVHTNAVQQRKMVKIMKEEWGDYLLDQPVAGTDPRLRLPTLGELQYKILVKVKKPTSLLSSPSPLASATVATTAVAAAAAAAAGSKMAPGNGTTATAQSMARSLSLAPTFAAPDNGSVSGSEDDVSIGIGRGGDAGAGVGAGAAGNTAPAKKTASSSHLVITEELGSLAVYTESRHFSNFADRDAKAPAHIFSLSETTIDVLHLKQHEELFHHNKTYLMRAYPNATKHVMSSNPDPACCWRRGVQMVALNWQTLDKAMMLNHGMFEGSHGWVRKPPGYRFVVKPDDEANANINNNNDKAPSVLDANTTCPVNAAEPARTLDLYITVLAGQHVPLPPALRKKTKGSRSTHQRNGYAGAADRILFPAGIVSGRAHAAFRPVVKCELNVERADERCPEAAAAARTAAAATSASSAAPTAATTTVTATATAIAAATAATTATATTTATAATTAKITAATTAAASVPSTTTTTTTTTATTTAETATATATTTTAAAPAASVPSSRFSFASSFATTVAPAAPSLATSSLAATPSLNQTSFPAPSTGGSKLPKAQLKQKTKPGQSDHPDWGARGTTLRFVNVTGIVESLSFVGFYVEDEAAKTPQERAKHALGRNDTLAGWACIRLDRLQTGYRFVRLMDAWGQATEGKLLVRIEKLLR